MPTREGRYDLIDTVRGIHQHGDLPFLLRRRSWSMDKTPPGTRGPPCTSGSSRSAGHSSWSPDSCGRGGGAATSSLVIWGDGGQRGDGGGHPPPIGVVWHPQLHGAVLRMTVMLVAAFPGVMVQGCGVRRPDVHVDLPDWLYDPCRYDPVTFPFPDPAPVTTPRFCRGCSVCGFPESVGWQSAVAVCGAAWTGAAATVGRYSIWIYLIRLPSACSSVCVFGYV